MFVEVPDDVGVPTQVEPLEALLLIRATSDIELLRCPDLLLSLAVGGRGYLCFRSHVVSHTALAAFLYHRVPSTNA
jgi:hypothetical protein